MQGAKKHCVLGLSGSHAPIMTLFFIWRLHGKPSYGYSLLKDVREIAISPCKPSTVYALLAKLESSGLVKSHFDESGARVRKLYQTTPKGWELLQSVKKNKIRGLWRGFIRGLLD